MGLLNSLLGDALSTAGSLINSATKAKEGLSSNPPGLALTPTMDIVKLGYYSRLYRKPV